MYNDKENTQKRRELDRFFDAHFDNICRPPVSSRIAKEYGHCFEVSEAELRELPYSLESDIDDQVDDNPWHSQSSSPDNHVVACPAANTSVSQPGFPSFHFAQPLPMVSTYKDHSTSMPPLGGFQDRFLPPISRSMTPVTMAGGSVTRTPLVSSPSRKWNVDIEQARCQIGNSAAAAKPLKPTAQVGERRFSGADLVETARQAVETNPFLAPHGQKGKVWQELTDRLVANPAFRLKNIESSSIRSKVMGLVAYKKNPASTTREVRAIANILDKNESYKITIAALLERLETQNDDAEHKSEEQKAALKQKQDEDNEGGAMIREASMRTFVKKRKQRNDSVCAYHCDLFVV
ncbi:hypothetical protein BDP27DRAFT_1359116 [Rhodocollybia butyracea]|uniref:Uncharacterized protein n=1 Tax=Rhodocollybia butyracea TaxID=206335 RepID=A0A9P5PYL5_9AGAR|nr:hypothetical protein BDP27DRAFT_1359115 [Rhodocollybia butyracea]KAF9074873.1 hypothetical protein BDP27DRAFT_1359116 [Rhodocollybia butyracea]